MAASSRWRIHEADIALGRWGFDLVKLSAVERLRRRLDLPVDEILTWWVGLGGRTYNGLAVDGTPEVYAVFDRVFYHPTLGAAVAERLSLSADRKALAGEATAGPSPQLSEHLDLLSAALGGAEADSPV